MQLTYNPNPINHKSSKKNHTRLRLYACVVQLTYQSVQDIHSTASGSQVAFR